MSFRIPDFPLAQQAQIIRANQRDLFYVGSLREQSDNVLRAWLGSRWLARWDKEVELAVKLIYYGLTIGRATQTLGEEYTRIWQQTSDSAFPPPTQLRTILVLLSTIPSYILARWSSFVSPNTEARYPNLKKAFRLLAPSIEILTEINLALFYLGGAYYDIVKRLLGVKHLTTIRPDPRIRPPSYSFLGVLLSIRLLHRLVTALRSHYIARQPNPSEKARGKQPERRGRSPSRAVTIDDRPVSDFLGVPDPEGEPAKPAEEDERTMLDARMLSSPERASRTCTLCLEERTDSTATECGHLFCWSCIVGWGREKAECPLCRQGLNLTKLLPVYNI